jgi:hypothetical protein
LLVDYRARFDGLMHGCGWIKVKPSLMDSLVQSLNLCSVLQKPNTGSIWKLDFFKFLFQMAIPIRIVLDNFVWFLNGPG